MQPKLTLLSDELIAKILEEAYELLQCPGIKVQNPEARDLLATAGAKLYPDNQVIGIPAHIESRYRQDHHCCRYQGQEECRERTLHHIHP